MVARIYIAIPCLNRRRVVEQCLPTMAASKKSCDFLEIWNDGSTEYGPEFLAQWADIVDCSTRTRGIQEQRKAHFRRFWALGPTFSHMYLSDSDALMDPEWRLQALTIQDEAKGALTCLYNTKAHTDIPGNVIDVNHGASFFWQKNAPGISYLLTREHVEYIMPVLDSMDHFDWFIPSLFGHRCAISRTSYVEHIGIGGERHPKDEGINGGDRATRPTKWLSEKRSEVVAELCK